MYNVDIRWILPDRGGKLFQPSTGIYFCTTDLTDEENNKSSWSIKLLFNEDNPLEGKLDFLFDSYPKDCIKKGVIIELFEGPNVVGYAKIKN